MPFVKRHFSIAWIVGFSALPLVVSAIESETLARRLNEASPPRVLDVRPTHEFEIAHIPGALNIPLEVLSRRTLPPLGEVIVVADGQGAVDPAAAAALLRQRDGIQVDILEGGFAAWESSQRSSTRRSGLSLEALPALTYDQLVAGKEADVVLVDLRQPVAAITVTPAAKAAPQLKTAVAAAPAATTPTTDPIATLAGKLRGARVAGDPFANPAGRAGGGGDAGTLSAVAAAPAGKLATRASSNAVATTPTTTSPTQAAGAGGVAPLLVLIDENDGKAQETARRLLASGNRRFVILSGGVEAVRMEGRSLVERTGGTVKLGGSTP